MINTRSTVWDDPNEIYNMGSYKQKNGTTSEDV